MKKEASCVKIIIRPEYGCWYVISGVEQLLDMAGITQEIFTSQFSEDFLMLFPESQREDLKLLCGIGDCQHSLKEKIYTLLSSKGPLSVSLKASPSSVDELGYDLAIRAAEKELPLDCPEKPPALCLDQFVPGGLCQLLRKQGFPVIWHNQEYLEMIGYSEEQFREELHSLSLGSIHPEDREHYQKKLDSLPRDGSSSIMMETRMIRRDGTVRTLLVTTGVTGQDQGGVPVLYSASVGITRQKASQRLEEDARQLESRLEQASCCVWEYSIPGHKFLASKGLERVLGIQGEVERVPESLLENFTVHPDSAEAFQALFLSLGKGERRREGVFHMRGASGGYRWLKLRLSVLFSQKGTPEKAVILAEDMTSQEPHRPENSPPEQSRRGVTGLEHLFACRLNLTRNRILEADPSEFPAYSGRQGEILTITELIRLNAGQYIHPDDRNEYGKRFHVENMLENFQRELPDISLDYRLSSPEGGWHWKRADIQTVREPVHGDICAYVYTRNIDAQKNRELELRRHAEADSLTGLYNRYTTELKCGESLRNRRENMGSALFMMDLDNFKNVNDMYGHARGDEALIQTANGLCRVFEGRDALLGRLGGDEFIAYLPECQGREEAAEMAGRLCDSLREGLSSFELSISVGAALCPEDGDTFSSLYHCADRALYHAKRMGKNRFVIYDDSIAGSAVTEKSPLSRDWLLEESNDLIYVTDFFTYGLLYMNSGAKRLFQVEGDGYKNQKCYEVLHHLDHPCEFCTNHLLCRESFYRWEYHNPKLGRDFMLRDRIVDWYGLPARIEFATDVTRLNQQKKALQHQVQADQVIISSLRILSGNNSLDLGADLLLEKVGNFYQAERAYLVDYERQGRKLSLSREWHRGEKGTFLSARRWQAFTPLAVRCFERHENFILSSPSQLEGEAPEMARLLEEQGIFSQRAVPFFIGGQPAGLIGLDNPSEFQDELTVLETLGYFIAEELSRKHLTDRLDFLSRHDALTGFQNRACYAEYQEQKRNAGLSSLGVAVADINSLKEINRTRGHLGGDAVIKKAAGLLRDSFPKADIFRLSGDEFAIICENIPRQEFMDRVRRVQEGAALLEARGMSIGFSWSGPGADFFQMVTEANEKMLSQKHLFYSDIRNSVLPQKSGNVLLQDVLEAIRMGWYQVYLQPEMDGQGKRPAGAEALVRMNSSQYGFHLPGGFLPELEQERVIQYLDLYMFEEVCRILKGWKKNGREWIPISVNFSCQTLLEPGLLQTILRIAEAHEIPRGMIQVEITESLGNYETETIAEICAGIRSSGFRLSLDNFGIRYANMAVLCHIPADVLKIDKSLIQCLEGRQSEAASAKTVIKQLILLCGELGITPVAEGVETPEQANMLRSLHCGGMQGFLFGRPVPAAEFERMYFTDPDAGDKIL